jgi:hypothetical protein
MSSLNVSPSSQVCLESLSFRFPYPSFSFSFFFSISHLGRIFCRVRSSRLLTSRLFIRFVRQICGNLCHPGSPPSPLCPRASPTLARRSASSLSLRSGTRASFTRSTLTSLRSPSPKVGFLFWGHAKRCFTSYFSFSPLVRHGGPSDRPSRGPPR